MCKALMTHLKAIDMMRDLISAGCGLQSQHDLNLTAIHSHQCLLSWRPTFGRTCCMWCSEAASSFAEFDRYKSG
jgi:hypothetical protein